MPIRHKSIKMVRKDRLKKFIDRRLIRALGHPVREHILAVTNERISSTVEIGDEIELDVTAFHKQVQLLEELGCIEWVGCRPVRGTGATEHFYRAKTTEFFDEKAWQKVPASLKADIDLEIIQAFVDEAVKAMKTGLFHARDDKHTSWTPVVFDGMGWREAMKLLDATLSRLLEIQNQSAARILKTGEPGISANVAIFGFEASPDYVRPPRPPL